MGILGPQRLKVTRDQGGGYFDGIYQSNPGPPFFLDASVQPMDPDTLQALPEGARTSAKFTLFADDMQPELRTARLNPLAESDIVEFKGLSYRLESIGDWSAHAAGLPHSAYAMIKVGADEVK